MRFEKSVVIARPVEDVWTFLTNPDNVRRFSLSGSELRQSSPGPLGVGSTMQSHRLVLGRFDIRLQAFTAHSALENR